MDENECSGRIVGAAIEVHRVLRAGLLESAYRRALLYELRLIGLHVEAEVSVGIRYKGQLIADALRLDLLVEDMIVVELKAISQIVPAHRAQLLTYLRFADKRLGLLLNFHESVLKNGIIRIANTS